MHNKNGICFLSIIGIFVFILFPGCPGKKTVTKQPVITITSSPASLVTEPNYDKMFEAPPEREPINVVVSTDLIREIMFVFANSRAKGRVLIANGSNPLKYVPTVQDKKDMQAAKIVFYTGLGLEPALEDFLKTINNKVRIVALTDSLDKSDLIRSKDYASGYDPHFWWNPKLWEKAVLYAVKILAEFDREYEFNYKSTYIRYGSSLSDMNRYFSSWLERISPKNRYLLTLNPAFTYLGKAFNLETMSLLAPGSLQFDNKRLNEITAYVIKNNVKVIFPESQFPADQINQVIAAAKEKGYTLKMGEALFSYSLGKSGVLFNYLPAGREQIDRIYSSLRADTDPVMPPR